MHPIVKDGDMISVEPVALADIKKGDIILYRSGMGVIAHRLIRIEMRNDSAPRFILRGDALSSPDERVDSRDVLGKVVCVERGNRRIDPYSLTARVYRKVRFHLSRLKRWIFSKTALGLVQCRNFFSPPLAGGDEGEGEIIKG
jgi:hypothetical protein